jgi:prepilin-type N-terminal cleavage/methylation domain-containing protein/prepilin-type processing-associated H-X9-DG protein
VPRLSYRSRPGFTLIELIVTLAVISTLIGLLLPAIQMIRSAAGRAKCLNNVKQLSLAAHQYHDSFGALPSAFRTDRPATLNYANWTVRLLPHLDQENLWRQVQADFAKAPYPFIPPQHDLQDRVVPLFGCPADWRTTTAWTVTTQSGTKHVSVHSYLANVGTNSRKRDGVVYRNSRIGLNQISDGSSNTILFGERPPSSTLVYGWFYFGFGQDGGGSLDSVMGAREINRSRYAAYRPCGPGPFRFADGRPEDPCAAFHYWSLHPGGAHFAFCDGSARFLRYAADSILPALATRAGGEIASIPD